MVTSSDLLAVEPHAIVAPTRTVGRGFDAIVTLDPATGVVSKWIRAEDRARAAERALREFDYLGRLHANLSDLPYLTCPRPLGVDPDAGVVHMTFCRGDALDDLIETPGRCVLEDDASTEHVAEQIALGLERYTAAFGEPYDDLTTTNMIYDASSRVLALVDFTMPLPLAGLETDGVMAEISLGTFLGVGLYRSVRPGTVLAGRGWRRRARLTRALLQRVSAATPLDCRVMALVSDRRYRFMGSFGSPARRLWYATVGRTTFLARRQQVFGAVARPAPRAEP